MRRFVSDETGLLPDLSLYEHLIDDGIAAADRQRAAVDHVTARRLAIWLAARPQQSDLARGLTRFVRTGAITGPLKTQLRIHAVSQTYANQPQAGILLRYCISRGADLGPVGPDFASACDQIDRADLMLAGLRIRVRHGIGVPEPKWPETEGPPVLAEASRDPESSTVSLTLDPITANIAMFAVAAYASDREAHVREVMHMWEKLPPDSYGRRNRETIARRETRVATRLRTLERAYLTALDRAPAIPSEDPTTIDPGDRVPDHEMEIG